MNKALILALILAALFQLFFQRKTGIYYEYDDGVFDPYEPVYTAKDNSDITRVTLLNNKYGYIAIAIIFIISELI
jgi:hypothetical protein